MELLKLFPHPIIQGPMAGGSNTPQQVAAVSNAGALGSLAGSLLSPEPLRSLVGGIAVVGTVTTVEEALAWQAAGADAVIASGIEAGGHRGTFIGRQQDATLTAMALLPAVVAAVRIPVIAAGAIMDGADINRALA